MTRDSRSGTPHAFAPARFSTPHLPGLDFGKDKGAETVPREFLSSQQILDRLFDMETATS
jgi:hypothetical protein